jgi:ubiquinone/menaquinone biosynthesis C-methylase UbiE
MAPTDAEPSGSRRDGYGWQARAYDLVVEPMNAPLRERARALLPVAPGSVVVDVGCGTGAALAEYRDAGCRVRGADPSEAMLQRARERLGDTAQLRLMTGPEVPFPDDEADVVILSLVLHSITRPEALDLLGESARILAPGGRLLVTDFSGGGVRFPRGWWIRGMTVLAEVAAGPAHAGNSLAYLRAGALEGLLGSEWEVESSKRVAGGNIAISVLRHRD